MTSIVLPYPPSDNRLWRVYNGRAVMSDEARAYKREVASLARPVFSEVLTGPVAVTIDVYAPRTNGDMQNRVKITLDALQRLAYVDDVQVQELHVYRHLDRSSPRIEVCVCALPKGW